jgi:hypothetical protein
MPEIMMALSKKRGRLAKNFTSQGRGFALQFLLMINPGSIWKNVLLGSSFSFLPSFAWHGL